jgi:prepilin-type N-terminal cleavage/methylation domain-containing protein
MFSSRTHPKGFTLIEILIVLAIAGLVLLVVFLAVPALQRNARNATRKQDVAVVLAYVQEYITNNDGHLPFSSCNNTEADCFLRDVKLNYYDNQTTDSNNISLWHREYLGPFNDAVDQQLDPSDSLSRERIIIRTWTTCNGGLLTGVGANKNDIAAQYVIESAGDGSRQCLEI